MARSWIKREIGLKRPGSPGLGALGALGWRGRGVWVRSEANFQLRMTDVAKGRRMNSPAKAGRLAMLDAVSWTLNSHLRDCGTPSRHCEESMKAQPLAPNGSGFLDVFNRLESD